MVFNHKDSKVEFIPDAADKVCKLGSFLRIHAGCRFIKKKKAWICSKGPGNFQAALKSVWKGSTKLIANLIKSQDFQKLFCFFTLLFFFCVIKTEGSRKNIACFTHVFCNQNVCKNSLTFPETDILEGTGNSKLCDYIRSRLQTFCVVAPVCSGIELFHLAGREVFYDFFSLEVNCAVCRCVNACYNVKGRCFSGSVRTNQGNNFALIYIQRKIIYCHNAAKLHCDVFHFKNFFCFSHYRTSLKSGFFRAFSGLKLFMRFIIPARENSCSPIIPFW